MSCVLPAPPDPFLPHPQMRRDDLDPQSQAVGYTVTCDLCNVTSINELDLVEVIALRIESKIQSHYHFFYRFLKNMGPFFLIVYTFKTLEFKLEVVIKTTLG